MFTESLQIIQEAYSGYWQFLLKEISQPSWGNYFYWLLGISLFFFLMEVLRPWREGQPKFRKDFWLDAFYMFFNFFLIIYHAASELVATWFQDLLAAIGLTNLVAIEVGSWAIWAIWGQLLYHSPS